MKYFLSFLLLINILNADKVKVKTIACSSIELLKGSYDVSDDYVKLNLYSMQYSCIILDVQDKITSYPNDPESCANFVKVLALKDGNNYFVNRRAIYIEKYDSENSVKF